MGGFCGWAIKNELERLSWPILWLVDKHNEDSRSSSIHSSIRLRLSVEASYELGPRGPNPRLNLLLLLNHSFFCRKHFHGIKTQQQPIPLPTLSSGYPRGLWAQMEWERPDRARDRPQRKLGGWGCGGDRETGRRGAWGQAGGGVKSWGPASSEQPRGPSVAAP